MRLLEQKEYGMEKDSHAFKASVNLFSKFNINYALKFAGNGNNKDCQNFISSRELVWRNFFGDEPMPTPKPDTARTAAGTLGQGLGLSYRSIEAGLRQLDE
ncbi:MAG: hypothetical protein OXC46_01030 [Thaumarchaeota archaeon]|nr:hypothetical protein [Nitrososphaerota archaeon]